MKIGKYAFIFIPFLCAHAAAQDVATDELMKETHAFITKDLKDPDSAKFRNEFIRKFTNPEGKAIFMVCGEINAKNSYGGYTGFTPYYYLPSTGKSGRIRDRTNAAGFDIIYPVTCKNEKEGMEVIAIQEQAPAP